MSKKRKLLEKVLAGSKNIRFDEFVLLLEAFGFERKRITESHHIFRHPAVPETLSVQPDHNNWVKVYQLRLFLQYVEEYSLTMGETEENGT